MSTVELNGTPVTLWCIARGSTTAFKVTAGTDNDLSDLREIIKNKKPNDFANVDPDNLILWRVNFGQNVINTINDMLNDDNKLLISGNTVGATFHDLRGTNIRVVVGVPIIEQPVTVPKDITAEIIKQLVQSPGQLPNRSDLANFLNENPPVKIPLIPVHFFQFKTGDLDGITEEERDIYFIQNAEEECTSLYSKLLGQLIYPPSYGKNEDSYHGLWDSIIKNTIEIFGKQNASLPTLEFGRNTSKRITTGRNRPDMVVLVRNVCPFRGEEKSREDAGDPSKELTEKFKGWNYGDAPYLFAYYAVGVLVTFVTLHKPINKSHNKRKRSVYSERIAEFDLGRLSDRIRVMNFLRNICRILPIIVNLCPQRDSPDFETKIRSNGTVIELGYAVTKKFTDEEQVIHLKEIYGMLQANSVRFSDKLEYSSKHSVHLVPRGEQQEPSDLKELLQALICILTCLEGMHLIKPKPIMHRDVRWPNIIRHYDEYLRFILIDFDYATFSPADMPLEEFSESDHAPEMLTKKHNFKVDIWGVGNLVVSCNITGIPQELKSFSADLCNNSPSKRPTASNALNRAKEMFRKWFTNDDWLEKIVERIWDCLL